MLRMTADGLKAAEIAHKLGISPRTVEAHCEIVRLKLGARTAAHAVALWLRGR